MGLGLLVPAFLAALAALAVPIVLHLRHRDKDKVRFSYPLPLPGMEAMFPKGKKHGYTSAVEKTIVRVRVLHTSADEVSPSWEDIASRWSEPPPK